MKETKLRFLYVVFFVCVCLIGYSFAGQGDNSKEKFAWGFGRGQNHEQPVLDSKPYNALIKYGGIALGNKETNKIYLTFDSGYEAGYTEDILATLKKTNVKATFFITAHYLNSSEDLVKKMIEEGHEIGNHTVNHKDITSLSDEELRKEVMNLHTAVVEKTGYEMKYFRPPKGEFSEYSLNFLKSLGYTTVLWSNAYDDWNKDNQGRVEYGKNKLLDNLHSGSVILLHSTSRDNKDLLEDFINEARKMGYEFEKLDNFE